MRSHSFSLGVGVQCAANAMRRLPLGHSTLARSSISILLSHASSAEPWLHAASGIAIGYTCSKVVQWTEQKQKVRTAAAMHRSSACCSLDLASCCFVLLFLCVAFVQVLLIMGIVPLPSPP